MDNLLQQKLLKKYNYFSSYCNNIKTKEDFLLSKKEIENGLHEDGKSLFQLRQELFDSDPNRIDFDEKGVLKRAIVPKIRSLDGYKLSLLDLGMEAHPYSRQEEELQINYYYNAFVYAMTRVISLALLFDKEKDKLKWEREYSLAYERISALKDISGEIYGNDFRIMQEWNYFVSLCDVTKDRPQMLFGRMTQFTHYKPKANPTIKEMLEWMDIADNILKKKRQFTLEYDMELKKKREKARKEEHEREKKRVSEEKKTVEEEQRKKEFEYNRQLKLGNRILLLFFTALTVFVSFLAIGEGEILQETFDTIKNIAFFIAIPLIYSIYILMYREKETL